MSSNSDFAEGLRGAFPIMASAAPFAVLFGAVAIANGQTVAEAALMSATVFAGASQLVGIELFGHKVQPWLIVLSVLAVNFRHILYSAAIARFISHFTPLQKIIGFHLLTDPQFAQSVQRGESGKKVSFAWYLGFGVMIFVPWVTLTVAGGIFGRLVGDPRIIGIDVLLPIYFMEMVLGFRRKAGFLPIVVVSALASVLAYRYVGSPWHVSIGAVAGVALAAFLPSATAGAEEPVE
ncbi:AzlC family ABC transporter permease [Rhizobium sp. YJ-22]|uniref:AzlC family ABC transporter permease n=1 Tax=Rhizobium sp. YJ-22 TaxID=3037556 RepID=UPI001AC13E8E|nr:AzlC family ABC transporter permease [Rhizobium sp. YJ-22]MBN9031354.1 AzlC family ABC transporter permease [Hyphomicrobiales bacterium]MDG3575867.1 AzlC family ABC transporter permease [Rhizobium sp. YJ-22]